MTPAPHPLSIPASVDSFCGLGRLSRVYFCVSRSDPSLFGIGISEFSGIGLRLVGWGWARKSEDEILQIRDDFLFEKRINLVCVPHIHTVRRTQSVSGVNYCQRKKMFGKSNLVCVPHVAGTN